MASPYAVPLAALDAQVPYAEQTTAQPEPRRQHLPGDPVLWALPLAGPLAGGGGGADGAGGCGGGGDC